MSRLDQTFDSSDLIRIWLNNLESDERMEVFLFFFFFVPAVLPIEIILRIIETLLVQIIPFGLQRTIVSALIRYMRNILSLRVEALVLIFTARTRAVLLKGIEQIRGMTNELEEDG